MIVCHPLKIIFVKTKKVAGTSFEIALSNYCGDNCIITPIAEEKYREDLGIRGSQNYSENNFVNHTPAHSIKQKLPREIWNSYKKISICRNPYDTVASNFFYTSGKKIHRDPKLKLNDIFNRDHVRRGLNIVSGNLGIAPYNLIDTFVRYEHFEEDIEKLNIPGFYDLFKTISAKSEYRNKNYDLNYFKENFDYFVTDIKEQSEKYMQLFGYENYL